MLPRHPSPSRYRVIGSCPKWLSIYSETSRLTELPSFFFLWMVCRGSEGKGEIPYTVFLESESTAQTQQWQTLSTEYYLLPTLSSPYLYNSPTAPVHTFFGLTCSAYNRSHAKLTQTIKKSSWTLRCTVPFITSTSLA